MLKWLRHQLATLTASADIDWEVEPHLTDNVRALLKTARNEGDALTSPRVVRHILTFPDRTLAFSFRDLVPLDWTTSVSERDDAGGWQCECDRVWTPTFADLVLDTHRLWTLALSLHPTLWAYTGMYDESGMQMWYVAPPLLEYE
ncbi:hypothetical protein LF1_00120 [Rubripirellula obstinata]|uniref:Regulator of ribonuclease activity B domain-containing protein n=1 Tax=Rubripirellula obstinata TaxID=406547 RepID=A0A5B1CBY3_9BACT|nr:hypothetical protein LF1_00120 [Rubripirellula obstinata]